MVRARFRDLHLGRLALLASVLLGTVGCDQVTKHLARVSLEPQTPIHLLDGFAVLFLADNAGAFLGIGSSLPAPARLALFGAGVGLLLLAGLAYLLLTRTPRVFLIAGSLLVAGGLSNLLDRLFRAGHVTDFLVLRVGPLHTGVFNVADVAILTGAALLLLAARSAAPDTGPDSAAGGAPPPSPEIAPETDRSL